MRYLCLGLCLISLNLAAGVTEHFETIKKDPNALYAFFKEMPKGGELHYHLMGGAYPELMLSIAADGHYCLDPKTFMLSKNNKLCLGIVASGLMSNPSLYAKTIRDWSLKDFLPGAETAHDHFFNAFVKFDVLFADHAPALLADVLKRAADQHEHYLEVMFLPAKLPQPISDLEAIPANFPKLEQRLLSETAFTKSIQETKAFVDNLLPATRKYLGCDRALKSPVCEIEVRFQYHVFREQPLANFFAQSVFAFALANQSKAIVGVNSVQPEDGLIATRDYHKQMQVFDFLHQAYPKVNIALHAGELAPGMLPPEDYRFHIREAIALGHAQRIGHGVSIGMEDKAEALLQDMAARPVAVEINLISNRALLNVFGKQHPLNYYLAHQVPVVLSTDDEGLLRTDLTAQYVEAVLYHGLSYPTLKRINRNALTYSFLPGESLWADPGRAIPVAACNDLNSQECQAFVAKSEKAQLQRRLEQALMAFESHY